MTGGALALAGRPMEWEPAARVAAMLLDRAGEVLESGHGEARALIARAAALLQHQPEAAVAGPAPAARGGLASWQVLRVEAQVEARLDAPIRISDLAARVRLSTGHFSRAFRSSFGIAPTAYVVARRLARARHLMRTTDQSLCQIALACGFCDQPHFTRIFRRHVGTSPNDWRRRHRIGPAGSDRAEGIGAWSVREVLP
jgi:transcriptional regulator GlxA family with amidase domain